MKISNLPKATRSTNGDLITIVQGNTTKVISVKDFTDSKSKSSIDAVGNFNIAICEVAKAAFVPNNPNAAELDTKSESLNKIPS